MKVLNQDMKTGQFKPVYLLYGEEAFLKKSYKKRLKEAIVGDDTMNFHQFEGKGLDLKEIISLADTMPFFGERRLILLEDSGLFKGGGGELLVEYLPGMPDTSVMVFVESEVDKRSRMYKKVFTKLACAAALSPAAIAASTFFMEVFTLDLMDLFLAVLVCVTKILFLADLMLANLGTSD